MLKNEDIEGREEWISNLTAYRAAHSLAVPTEEELTSWRAEWALWSKKRRILERESIKAHMIITDCPMHTRQSLKIYY